MTHLTYPAQLLKFWSFSLKAKYARLRTLPLDFPTSIVSRTSSATETLTRLTNHPIRADRCQNPRRRISAITKNNRSRLNERSIPYFCSLFRKRIQLTAAFCFGQVGGAATFRWCGAAGEIHFTSVMLRRKQKRRVLFTSEKPRQRDHRKRL